LKYRIDTRNNSNFSLAESRTVTTFFNLIDLPVPSEENLRKILVTWNIHSLHNSFREFCFKFRNNILPLNNRINAFDPLADPRCGFCRIVDPLSRIWESFSHIFALCPIASRLIVATNEYFFDLELDHLNFKKFYWYGHVDGMNNLQEILIFFWDVFRYHLYRFKIARRIPNHRMLINDIIFFYIDMYKTDMGPLIEKWSSSCETTTEIGVNPQSINLVFSQWFRFRLLFSFFLLYWDQGTCSVFFLMMLLFIWSRSTP
jgi:hypothetical protein